MHDGIEGRARYSENRPGTSGRGLGWTRRGGRPEPHDREDEERLRPHVTDFRFKGADPSALFDFRYATRTYANMWPKGVEICAVSEITVVIRGPVGNLTRGHKRREGMWRTNSHEAKINQKAH